MMRPEFLLDAMSGLDENTIYHAREFQPEPKPRSTTSALIPAVAALVITAGVVGYVMHNRSAAQDGAATLQDPGYVSLADEAVPLAASPAEGPLRVSLDRTFRSTMLSDFTLKAQYVEISPEAIILQVQAPSFDALCDALGPNAYETITGAFWDTPSADRADAENCYGMLVEYMLNAYTDSPEHLMSKATIRLRDGASLTVEDLLVGETPWVYGPQLDWDQALATGAFTYQGTLSQPLDLGQLQSITIQRREYPLG